MRIVSERVAAFRSNGILVIASGTALGQLAVLVSAPLLARLYTPRDFGVLAVATSIAFTFGTVAALRLDAAIPLPASEDDARALVRVGSALCLLTTLLAAGVAWRFTGPLIESIEPTITAELVCVALAVGGIIGVYRVLNQWALRHRLYNLSARRNALQSLVTVAVQVSAGLAGCAHGLLLGLATGQTVSVLGLLGGPALRYERAKVSVRRILSRYKSFPLYLAPAGLLNAAGLYIPVLLFAAFYGPAAAGMLGFAQRVLGVPMVLIGQAVAQVYLAELARSSRQAPQHGRQLFRTATRRLSVVAAILALGLLAGAPYLFAFVFGADWRESGQMAQALGFALGAQLVAAPLSQTLIVLERTGWQFAWDAVRLLLTCGTIAICYGAGSTPITSVWWLSFVTVVAYLVSWDLSRRALASAGEAPN